jgi:predicted nucleotide-binding protein
MIVAATFLLISNSPACSWRRVLAEALEPFGSLDVATEATAPGCIERRYYDIILSDIHVTEEATMAKGTLLFADNDPDFLKTRKEILEQEGYRVLTAANPDQARQILGKEHVDLAILDIRLENDNDEKDLSGLVVAKNVALAVPKIMLTGFPTVETVREALSPALQGHAAAVDFVAKYEGPEALLRAVRTALLRNVFIVHGHDKAAEETVTLFIERLGLRAIILREQPSAGRTIIEMFEDYAHVGFAVVLLTPDDVGGMRDKPEDVRPRARQNVIFELGYFIGKLGRRKVGALYKGGVEIPSDYLGVLYVPMDPSGNWKLSLAREMKNAGMNIDLNRSM